MTDSGDTNWQNRRKEVTYQEARAVINHQLTTISDIDDKAIRTVRLTVILIGVVVTAFNIAETGTFNRDLFLLGGGALLASVLAGLVTYSESSLYLGPNRDYIQQLTEDRFHGQEWDDDLLFAMGFWIEQNAADISWNATVLSVTQALLAIGITLVGAAVVF